MTFLFLLLGVLCSPACGQKYTGVFLTPLPGAAAYAIQKMPSPRGNTSAYKVDLRGPVYTVHTDKAVFTGDGVEQQRFIDVYWKFDNHGNILEACQYQKEDGPVAICEKALFTNTTLLLYYAIFRRSGTHDGRAVF